MLEQMVNLEKSLYLPEVASGGILGGWMVEADMDPDCSEHFTPPAAPQWATDHNGIQLPDVCIRKKGPHYVQVIGDWGGLMSPNGPIPANQRKANEFMQGVDDCAQARVAKQMLKRAQARSPDYILNVGDSFYWGGLETMCGTPANQVIPTGQFQWVYEKMYEGANFSGKPWLGVLGNHDYGGYAFNKGWDQIIAYTWGGGGRWVVPAQYWRQIVHYPGFSVDYYFLDTNVFNAQDLDIDPQHNLCSEQHSGADANCGFEGPKSLADCPHWFAKLWETEQVWLDKHLSETEADWQVIVTHFPPRWGMQVIWKPLVEKHGVDLILTGHTHNQELHHMEETNPLKPTAWVVSGGGGGITSEHSPSLDGNDDQYGFFELTLTKEVILIQGITHGGQLLVETFLTPRPRAPKPEPEASTVRNVTDADLENLPLNMTITNMTINIDDIPFIGR